MKEKLIQLTAKVFMYGIVVLLIFGALTALVYVIAFILGGTAAENIVVIVNDILFPVAFVLNIIICVVGIVHCYLVGDRSFRFDVGSNRGGLER